jgi:hypothetical protein
MFANLGSMYVDLPTNTTSVPTGNSSEQRHPAPVAAGLNECNRPCWKIICICREEQFNSELLALEVWS